MLGNGGSTIDLLRGVGRKEMFNNFKPDAASNLDDDYFDNDVENDEE